MNRAYEKYQKYCKNPVSKNENYRVSLDYGEVDVVKEKTLRIARKHLPKSTFKSLRKTKSKASPFYQQLIDEQEAKIKDFHRRGNKVFIKI